MKLVIFELSIGSSWAKGHATLWCGVCRSLTSRGLQGIRPLAELQAAGSGCINCDGSGGQALVPAQYVDEVTDRLDEIVTFKPFWEAR